MMHGSTCAACTTKSTQKNLHLDKGVLPMYLAELELTICAACEHIASAPIEVWVLVSTHFVGVKIIGDGRCNERRRQARDDD